ncbi:hypothetical protein [Neobacillus jeddahensis]|nr:hypothetical protein [Neobacillus jeddahensis]
MVIGVFFALQFLGKLKADCIIEKLSSEDERIVKRLSMELHTKRRTAYQLEKMINHLLKTEKYDVKSIAGLCNVTEKTLNKYIQGLDVNLEWIRRGEKTGAGRHAFTDIHSLNLSEEDKNFIADLYINRNINKAIIDVIKKAAKEEAFEDIPEENIKKCLSQIIDHQLKEYEQVKEILYNNSLQANYNEKAHTFMHNLVLNLLKRIEKSFKNKYYVNYVSIKQRDQLNKLLRSLFILLNPPLKWSEFPKKDKLNRNPEDETG